MVALLVRQALVKYWSNPHIADIEEQIRWEMVGVERGVERAREAFEDRTIADGDVGRKLIALAVPRLAAVIKSAQEEAMAHLTKPGRGRPLLWWLQILTLTPEQLAVITFRAVLNYKPRDFTFNRPLTAVCVKLDLDVKLQLDFEDWKEDERAKTKAGGKDENGRNLVVNQYERFLRSTKQVNAKTFKKFCEKIERRRKDRWSREDGIAFAAKLIELLCLAIPEWLHVEYRSTKGGASEKQIIFSEECKALIAEIVEQTELSRPLLMPMICPPEDWHYVGDLK